MAYITQGTIQLTLGAGGIEKVHITPTANFSNKIKDQDHILFVFDMAGRWKDAKIYPTPFEAKIYPTTTDTAQILHAILGLANQKQIVEITIDYIECDKTPQIKSIKFPILA